MNGYRLADGLHYVDKTQRLEKALEAFPAVYIEGAAASGKSTAVKMLLAQHSDVTYDVYDMQSASDRDLFEEDCQNRSMRASDGPTWTILENIPERLPVEIIEKIKTLIGSLCGEDRVIMIGREPMEETFLALLWSRGLELLPQKVLLFTREEVRAFADRQNMWRYADEIYEITGGYAGCVDLFLRLLKYEPEHGARSVKTLCQSYECGTYIRQEIWGQLNDMERRITGYAHMLPWLDGELVGQIIGLSDAHVYLERLERKGIFLHRDGEEHWVLAPIFQYSQISDSECRETILSQAAVYYEENGYVQDALECYALQKDADNYRACAIRNYKDIPFSLPSHTDVMCWEGDAPAAAYLRGLYCYLSRDFAGLKKEIKKIEHSADQESQSIYLNLCYMDPDMPLESWLLMVQIYAKNYGSLHLFHMLGDSRSYLCGIRDLSELFMGRKKVVQRKQQIWQSCLGEAEWTAYQLAQAEYFWETDEKERTAFEDYRVLFPEKPQKNQQVEPVLMHLMCKLWQTYQSEKLVENIDTLHNSLHSHKENWRKTDTLLHLQHLWIGESFALNWWKKLLSEDTYPVIRITDWSEWWYRAKGYLYLNKQERVAEILKELIPLFREYHFTYFLAEALFMMAVVRWKQDNKSNALRYIIESLLVAQEYRYVGFYTRYGQSGCEVIEVYISWLEKNEPERWNRKKKYNYGDVRYMTYAEYVGVILRKARKNRRIHPNIETFEESLTMMERIVLQDISQGLSNAQICEAHNLKLPTVKGHLYSLYKKLDVKNRVQAIKKAKELEILK